MHLVGKCNFSGDSALKIVLGRSSLALAGHDQTDADAQEPADKDLNGSMADKLAQAFFSERFPLKGIVDHLVEDASLNTHGAAHPGGIVHDNACQHCGDGKSW